MGTGENQLGEFWELCSCGKQFSWLIKAFSLTMGSFIFPPEFRGRAWPLVSDDGQKLMQVDDKKLQTEQDQQLD